MARKTNKIIFEDIRDDIMKGTYPLYVSLTAAGWLTVPKVLMLTLQEFKTKHFFLYYNFQEKILSFKGSNEILPDHKEINPNHTGFNLGSELTKQHANKFYGRLKLEGHCNTEEKEFRFPLIIPESSKTPPYALMKKGQEETP